MLTMLLFGWIVLSLTILSEGTHFRGGTITWKPIYNNISSSSLVSIMIIQTYTWTQSQIACTNSMIINQSPPINLGTRAGSGSTLNCSLGCSNAGGYVGNEVPITGYCTDQSTALDLTVSQRSDIVNLTVGARFTATFTTGGGWQSLALGSSSGWSLSTLIDLSIRPDNGLINTPPVATCISFISIPVNNQQIIQIPVLDADNDILRCRFANGTNECYNTCPPGSLPPGTTLSSSCTLTIIGPTAGSYYLVAAHVEDFLTNTSTIPMSSVPIQFLVYVYAVPSCTLKPILLSDLNNQNCQATGVGANFTMTFTAVNQCGSGRTITDIATLSFPILIKSVLVQDPNNASLWSLTITWQPTISQVGSQVLCAVASDSASVQSDQYCIRIFVVMNSADLCPGSTTTISVTTDSTTEGFSTAQPGSEINWPLIGSLIGLGLLLAICCAFCWCYYFFGPGKICRRRQPKRKKEFDNRILAGTTLELENIDGCDLSQHKKIPMKPWKDNTSISTHVATSNISNKSATEDDITVQNLRDPNRSKKCASSLNRSSSKGNVSVKHVQRKTSSRRNESSKGSSKIILLQ